MSKIADIIDEIHEVMTSYMELCDMIPDSDTASTGKNCLNQLNRRFLSLLDDLEKAVGPGQKAA